MHSVRPDPEGGIEKAGRWPACVPVSRHLDLARLHAPDPGFLHIVPCRGKRAVQVDPARCIFDHRRLEAELARIERRPGYAIIGGQPAHKYAADLAPLQVAGEPGLSLAIGFKKRRIAVHVTVESFAYDELRMRDIDPTHDCCTLGALHAVFRP